MRTNTWQELIDHLDAVLDAVEAGKSYVITKDDGVPFAEIVPSSQRDNAGSDER